MKKIVFFYETGFCGTNTAELVEFSDDVTNDELDRCVWENAVQWAESYGVYPECDRESNGETDEEFDDTYSDNIEGYWEVYDSDKHDHLI